MTLALPKPVKVQRPRTRLRRSPLRRGVPLQRTRKPIKRAKRPNARKKGETAELRREAEKLCSLICRAIAGGRCEYQEPGMRRCWQPGTDAAHAINKKAWPSVRYELLNLFWLCRRHHELADDAPVGKESAMKTLFLWVRGQRQWDVLVAASRLKRRHLPDLVAELRRDARICGVKA